jgi:replicative DNA helicase
MYAKEKTPQEAKGVAEIIIGKNRSGPMRDVKLACLSQFTRFEDRRRTSNRTSRFFRTTCGLYSS